jgi:hypothetical protein
MKTIRSATLTFFVPTPHPMTWEMMDVDAGSVRVRTRHSESGKVADRARLVSVENFTAAAASWFSLSRSLMVAWA